MATQREKAVQAAKKELPKATILSFSSFPPSRLFPLQTLSLLVYTIPYFPIFIYFYCNR